MDAVLELLLPRPIGLLSLFAILSIIGIGFFMSAWIGRKMPPPKK